jgi:hypothetical protein
MDQARRFGVLIDVGRKVLFTRCCIAGWVMVGRLYRVYIYLYVLSSTKHVLEQKNLLPSLFFLTLHALLAPTPANQWSALNPYLPLPPYTPSRWRSSAICCGRGGGKLGLRKVACISCLLSTRL